MTSGELVHVFVPVPQENERQSVEIVSITTSLSEDPAFVATIDEEQKYGNRFWHATVPMTDGAPIIVEALYRVTRHLYSKDAATRSRELNDAERQELALFLGANSRIAVDNIEYKKVGNGDKQLATPS